MSRLSSAFEAPPEPESMLARLEESVVDSPFMAKLAIMLAHEDASGLANVPPSTEPLPHIDYHLVYTLIALAGRLDKRELKTFDYLIDARNSYYKSHRNFRDAFNCLQDTRAYGLLLERENVKLAKLGSTAAKELESNEIALRKNYQDLCRWLNEVESRRKDREQITTWFSKMKYVFFSTQMARLIYVGKKAFQRAMTLQGKLSFLIGNCWWTDAVQGRPTQPIPLVAPVQPRVTQTAVAPQNFESLTCMLDADMSEEDLLHAAARINNHAQQPPDLHPDVSKLLMIKNGSLKQISHHVAIVDIIANSLSFYSLETDLLQGRGSWKTESEPPSVTPLEWGRVGSMYGHNPHSGS